MPGFRKVYGTSFKASVTAHMAPPTQNRDVFWSVIPRVVVNVVAVSARLAAVLAVFQVKYSTGTLPAANYRHRISLP